MYPQETIDRLVELEKESLSFEMCGIIDSNNVVHPITNDSKDPDSFIFNKREYFTLLSRLLKEKTKVKATYHSHRGDDNTPSAADLSTIGIMKRSMVIISNGKVRCINYE